MCCIKGKLQAKQKSYHQKGDGLTMKDCIFSAHCMADICAKACPTLVETAYLLERNGIEPGNSVFHTDAKGLAKAVSQLHNAKGKVCTIISDNTIATSTLLTYCAICENWQGNRLHCNV